MTTNLIPITLQSCDTQTYHAEVKDYTPTKTPGSCPSTPEWIDDLIDGGLELSLPDVIWQASRHFAKFIPNKIATQTTQRRKASQITNDLLQLRAPSVTNQKLIFNSQTDQDLKRLTSELFGVGSGIEMLRSQRIIDARTLDKRSTSFDFDAFNKPTNSSTLIELKGSKESSRGSAQESIRKKINNMNRSRGWGNAIAVISLWSDTVARFADFQIADPETDADPVGLPSFARRILEFYSTSLLIDGFEDASEEFRKLSESDKPTSGESAEKFISNQDSSIFGRYRLELQGGDAEEDERTTKTALQLVNPPNIPTPTGFGFDDQSNYRFCFAGLETKLIKFIRNGDWEKVIAMGERKPQWKYWSYPPDREHVETERPDVLVTIRPTGRVYLFTDCPRLPPFRRAFRVSG